MRRVYGLMMALILLSLTVACAGQGGEKAAVLATVRAFETAYMQKNKQRMLMALMAPTKDAVKVQQRYEWLRGHGPGDAPNTAPVLFQSARGSFVPTRYTILTAIKESPTQWKVIVSEEGRSFDQDEIGGVMKTTKYRVIRKRHFQIVKVGKKWMVGDYYLLQNRENYGFPVDDIADKMQALGN
jgi:hypothetical protein